MDITGKCMLKCVSLICQRSNPTWFLAALKHLQVQLRGHLTWPRLRMVVITLKWKVRFLHSIVNFQTGLCLHIQCGQLSWNWFHWVSLILCGTHLDVMWPLLALKQLPKSRSMLASTPFGQYCGFHPHTSLLID